MATFRDIAVKSVFTACALLSQVITIEEGEEFTVSPPNAGSLTLIGAGIPDVEDFRQQLITLLPAKVHVCVGGMPLTPNSKLQEIIDFVVSCFVQAA